jgi:hypothetical protein
VLFSWSAEPRARQEVSRRKVLPGCVTSRADAHTRRRLNDTAELVALTLVDCDDGTRIRAAGASYGPVRGLSAGKAARSRLRPFQACGSR